MRYTELWQKLLKNKTAGNIASYENLAVENTQSVQNEQNPGLIILEPEINPEPISESVPEIVAEYNNLAPEQKLNYTDLSEYIQTKYPSK